MFSVWLRKIYILLLCGRVATLPSSFVLSSPQASGVCQVPSTLQTGDIEASTLGRAPSPEKNSECWIYFLVFSFHPQKEAKSGEFPPDCVPGEGTMVKKYHKFSYWLWYNWFHAQWGCSALLSGLLISHKGNWSMYCCGISVSVEEKGCDASCSTILPMSPSRVHYWPMEISQALETAGGLGHSQV